MSIHTLIVIKRS